MTASSGCGKALVVTGSGAEEVAEFIILSAKSGLRPPGSLNPRIHRMPPLIRVNCLATAVVQLESESGSSLKRRLHKERTIVGLGVSERKCLPPFAWSAPNLPIGRAPWRS